MLLHVTLASMISEAAITGKPIYVAQYCQLLKIMTNGFKSFFNLFEVFKYNKRIKVNSVTKLELITKLNETNKIAKHNKRKNKTLHDFS